MNRSDRLGSRLCCRFRRRRSASEESARVKGVAYCLANEDEKAQHQGQDEEACEAEPAEDARGPQHFVVTKKQPYEFVGQLPAPVGFDELALEYDTRVIPEDGGVQVDRLLRWVFSDPEVSEDGLQWTMFYDAVPDALNPNLIRTAYLSDYTRPLDCGKEQIEPTTAYAKVEYEYQKLSDYLLSVIR